MLLDGDVTHALAHLALSFGILVVVFVPLERAFGPPRPAWRRPEFITDGMFFVGQTLLFVSVVTAVLQHLSPLLEGVIPHALRAEFSAWPFALQAVVVVVLADVVLYFGHRAMHRVDVLWRFHAVHHSAHHLDWLAAYREHPLDGLMTMFLVNLPAFLLGFPLDAIAAYLVVRGMWSVFIHSNVDVNLGIVGLLFGDPALHRWHHAQSPTMQHNYANMAPYLDVLFGTHHRPAHREYPLGLQEPWPRGYVAQLVWPLVRPRPR